MHSESYNYIERNGKIEPIDHNRRIHNFFYALNILLPIEKRLSDTEIERISSYLYEVLEKDNKRLKAKLKEKQTIHFSIRLLIAILEDLRDAGYRKLTLDELVEVIARTVRKER